MVSWECPTNPREASGLDPEAVHYEVALEIDGRPPRTAPVRRVAFTPVPEGADGGQYLGVEVQADGELTWVLSGTPDTSV